MAELFEKSKRDYLDYLFEQYKKGLLDDASLTPLIEAGYITSKPKEKKGGDMSYVYEKQKEETAVLSRRDYFVVNYEKYASFPNNISREDWIPASVISHSDDFYEWINNITFGYFTDAIERHEYKKYELYKAQCFKWLAEDSSPTNHVDEERKIQCIKTEYSRCRQNTMYFAIKYCYVKEGDDSAGKIRYKPKEVNSFLFYLLDCGYSLFIGKPRQIYSSTTMGIYALKKILLQKNYFIKFIAEDDKTVQEIFRDKIKYPFAELPVWMTPKVLSDSAENFWLGQKVTKGEIKGQNSRIAVVPPTVTAINGGSPQLVFIDEIGSINILTEMIAEGLPTMFMDKYGDGNLEMKRQLVAWGTGVGSAKGKGAYQREWYRILGLWEEKNKQLGFVPIFLSWHTRCNAKHYKEQKAIYYGGKNLETGIDLETNKKMFHQHYPSSFKDMFILSGNTLVGKELIDEGLSRIRKIDHSQRPVAGYLEPVFDYTKPESENSDVPFKIIDANFIPCNDDEMDRATCWRLLPPDRSWINRYYSGVDPIAVETGHSMFSTTIWDKFNHAPVCILNFRKQHDHKYCFLQSVLMEIYYDTNRAQNNKEGCPDLIEANIGTNYVDYCERAGFFKHFVYTSELPERLRGGARKIGVDNKGLRALYIIDKMRECVKTYYKNFYFEVIFKQLDTFVQKTTSKTETWEALDKIAYFDDVLFSLTYAYINAEYVHDHKVPQCIEQTERQISKIKYPKKSKADGSLTRRPEKKLIKTSIW